MSRLPTNYIQIILAPEDKRTFRFIENLDRVGLYGLVDKMLRSVYGDEIIESEKKRSKGDVTIIQRS